MKRRRIGRGEITPLKDLFAIYKTRLKPPQQSVVKEFVVVVYDVLQIELSATHCRYVVSNRTLVVTAPGPIKAEIKLQEDTIKSELMKRLGSANAPTTIL